MSDLIVVGISDFKISMKPHTIVTYALGSCVGTAIYDEVSGIGGLSHIMLPDNDMVRDHEGENRMKFANTALIDMVDELVKKGADRTRLKAKITGGANMFENLLPGPFGNIGDRNVESVKTTLKELGIPVYGEDTGANYGRTVFFDLNSGILDVKSIGHGIVQL